jgi:hypothetical protein
VTTQKNDIAVLEKQAGAREKIPLSYDQLGYSFLAPGDIYWMKKNKQLVKIFHAGDYLLPEVLTKFRTGKKILVIDQLIDMPNIKKGLESWRNFCEIKDENERVKIRREILRWFSDIYWTGKKSGSLLDLAVLGQKQFYSFDQAMTDQLRNIGVDSFNRSFLVAGFAVFSALAMGHTDYNFLKDFYNVCFFLEYGLKENFTYNIRQALELERQNCGKGLQSLHVGDKTSWEYNVFFGYPEKSYKKVLSECKTFFHSEDAVRPITRQHERIDGTGFPNRVNADEMNDLESILVAFNHLVPYGPSNYVFSDGKRFLQEFVSKSAVGGNFCSKRLKKIFSGVFENLDDEKPNETEKKGEGV